MKLSSVKISTKIVVSFVLFVLVAIGLSAIGIRQNLRLNNEYKEKIEIVNGKIIETSDAAVYSLRINKFVRDMIMNAEDLEAFESASMSVKESQEILIQIAGRYGALLTGEYEQQAFAQNGENIGRYFALIGDIENGIRSGTITVGRAKQLLYEEGAIIEKAIIDAMVLANETATKELNEVVTSNTNSVNRMVQVVALITLLIIIMAIISSIILLKSINEPIKKLVNASKRISKGNLDLSLRSNDRDEMSVLSNEIATVVDTLNELIHEVYTMAEDIHKEGDVERRIDESKFDGGYLKLVSGINMVIDGLTGDTIELIGCLGKYAEGDFDAQITRYIGKKAILNDAVDSLQGNLKAIVSDINGLANAASNGDLTQRIDANKYKNDWAGLATSLNYVLVDIINPVRETISVLESMAKGNLSVHIEGDYKGEYLTMKIAVNEMMATLSKYINDISSVLNKMSKGEFDLHITTEYIGDFLPIKVSLTNILDTFNDLLGNINALAEDVADKAELMLKSSIKLSEETDQQVGAVNHSLESVSTITDQTRKNTNSSENANVLAQEATSKSSSASKEMQDMLEAMNEINDASNNISKIIKVIEDIAFQTNLLALNAAVEAAHAGEHGKGFAVVAQEVRNLAHRSQEAVSNTAALIEGSVNKVNDGMNIANKAADALIQVSNKISEISELIDNIAKASVTQESAIDDIKTGMNTISEITNKNASFIAEEAIAAKDLDERSDELKYMLEAFKFRH